MQWAGGFQFSQKYLDKAKTDGAHAQSIIFVHQSLSQGGGGANTILTAHRALFF